MEIGFAPSGWQTIADMQVAPITNTGTTTENTLLTLTDVIPAGAMGARGILRIMPFGSASVSDASVKTLRTKVNGATVSAMALTSLRSSDKVTMLRNRTAGTQFATNSTTSTSFGSSNAVIQFYTFDTTLPLTISFTAQNALNADSITLEHYLIELLRRP